jgi:hypothetical protein
LGTQAGTARVPGKGNLPENQTAVAAEVKVCPPARAPTLAFVSVTSPLS